MDPIEIVIPEMGPDKIGPGCPSECPFWNGRCHLGLDVMLNPAWIGRWYPGPRCPGAGTYALVPVADLARMREALQKCRDICKFHSFTYALQVCQTVDAALAERARSQPQAGKEEA